jgi:hypothetical protein
VTTRLDSIRLEQEGLDRVRISGVVGEPPPPQLKVSLNSLGGHRNEMSFVLTGLDIEAKADLARTQLEAALSEPPEGRPAEVTWTLARLDRPNAPTEQQASALLTCTVRDRDPAKVGRAFSGAAVELALATYPGCTFTGQPGAASPYGVFTAGWVDPADVPHTAVLPDGRSVQVPPAPATMPLDAVPEPDLPEPLPAGEERDAPLGLVAGARSGDKGGDANIGLWVRTDDEWRWLVHALTVEELRRLLPEAADLPVTRHVFPHLRAVNFVIEGILGEGVAYNARFDPQAKGLAEWLRSRHLGIPVTLLERHAD